MRLREQRRGQRAAAAIVSGIAERRKAVPGGKLVTLGRGSQCVRNRGVRRRCAVFEAAIAGAEECLRWYHKGRAAPGAAAVGRRAQTERARARSRGPHRRSGERRRPAAAG
eukprot:6282116-Prymnesium_polylepis.1